jgi:hypothetical protein
MKHLFFIASCLLFFTACSSSKISLNDFVYTAADLAQDENMSATVKYKMPCFCYKNKMCCYLWTDKKTKEPYILFVEGKLLDFPQLELGDRARMKIFRVNPTEDIQIELLETILNAALDLYRNGTIKTK